MGRRAKRSRKAVTKPDAQSSVAARFSDIAARISQLAGRPATFATAAALVVLWAASGPLFGFSDTWQLMVNTTTTIVTFLMVFLIQNTQNRDTAALQIKLDSLIFATHGAEDKLAAAEDMSDEELEELHRNYRERAQQTFETLKKRRGSRTKTKH